MAEIRAATDLIVYQKAYALAMEIFRLSKSWPSEEIMGNFDLMPVMNPTTFVTTMEQYK
jgi:hypothetical protein